MKFTRILLIILAIIFVANSVFQSIEIHKLNLAVINISSNIDDLDTKITSLDESIENVQSEVSDVKEQVESVQGKLNAY